MSLTVIEVAGCGAVHCGIRYKGWGGEKISPPRSLIEVFSSCWKKMQEPKRSSGWTLRPRGF